MTPCKYWFRLLLNCQITYYCTQSWTIWTPVSAVRKGLYSVAKICPVTNYVNFPLWKGSFNIMQHGYYWELKQGCHITTHSAFSEIFRNKTPDLIHQCNTRSVFHPCHCSLYMQQYVKLKHTVWNLSVYGLRDLSVRLSQTIFVINKFIYQWVSARNAPELHL